jgi:hypothetical protein
MSCRLPTVGLIVPVFGLALAPYWRSAGCRARHRARALGAALDRYVKTRLCGEGIYVNQICLATDLFPEAK